MTINDPNRRLPRDPEAMRDGTSNTTWAIIAVVAVLIVGGFMFYNSGGHGPDQTASNSNTPTTSQTAPAPSPIPGSATTPPAATPKQ
jgi:hypothetical protein